MFNVKLKCGCGASFQIEASPGEYRDASYTIQRQVDNWLETHKEHTPLPPQSSTPPINKNPLGLGDSEPI